MKRNLEITTKKFYEHKAYLNSHGGQQEFGVNYFQACPSAVNCFSTRLIMLLSITNNWNTRQIDFVLAYPQEEIKCGLFMKLPNGFKFSTGDIHAHVLLLKRNFHGQKQSGRMWNQHLIKGLKKIEFQLSVADKCVFCKGNNM